MKKFLKNASLFIIAIVFTFGFNLNVNAADACDGLEGCRITGRDGGRTLVMYGPNKTYRQLTASTTNTKSYVFGGDVADGKYHSYFNKIGVTPYYNGTAMKTKAMSVYTDPFSALYCLDAHKEGFKTLYAERFLLDSSSKGVMAFDYGLMSILTSGSNSVSSDAASVQNYWAKLTAIRALTITWGYYSVSGANDAWLANFRTSFGLVDRWLTEDHSTYDSIDAEIDLVSRSTFASYKNYYFEGSLVNTAKSLYFNALKEVDEYLKSGAGEVKFEQTVQAGEIESSGDKNNEFVKKDVVHTIKISGISKDGSFIISPDNNGIQFAEGTQYDGLTSYISSIEFSNGPILGTKEEVAEVLGKNFVELGYLAPGEENTIKVTVHFEGWKTSTNKNITTLKCGQQPIKYSIKGTYNNGGAGKYSNYVATIWYSAEANTQRYVGIEEGKNVQETPWTSPYETYLIPACSCDDLVEACVESGDVGSEECQELKDANCGDCTYLEAVCEIDPNSPECDQDKLALCDVTCDTTFDTFECCDEQGELIVSTIDDQEVSILGPKGKDIKACYVNSVDAQWQGEDKGYSGITGVKDQKDNTYTLGGTISENKYCTVSCKEDYVMTMPTAKLVNAGRYFTFKAKVEGTKTCYTNTIDRDQYNKDIIEAQEEMILAYDNYKYWEAAKNSSNKEEVPKEFRTTADPGECNCNYGGYETWINYTTTNDFNYIGEKKTYIDYENGIVYSRPNADDGEERVTSSINCSVSAGSTDGKPCTYNPETNKCTGGCESRPCTVCRLIEERDLGDLNLYLEDEFGKAQGRLRDAKKEYERIIKEFHECTNDTWTSEMNYDPEIYYDYEEDYLNEHGLIGEMDRTNYSNNTDTETWFCEGKNNIDKTYSKCTSGAKYNRDSTLKTIKYTVCTEEGCEFEERPAYNRISSANYVKKSSEVSASYKPATLFYNIYPSGEITVNKDDNNVAIENGLPVALNTKRGIYKYTVNIENLGEFYHINSKDNLGRYVGSSTAVVDSEKLEYACSYLVNIQQTNGWICDFDETCTNDCISNCIGPNCDGYCDGNNCIADCIGLGCIYDEDAGTSLVEKTVSLNNLFPNGTDSYNWDRSRNDKALTTVSEIEGAGNTIYDETPILSITLDPSSAREIKRYNDAAEGEGGYSNSTIYCYKLDDYEESACYSTFIDSLLDGEYGNEVVNKDSLIASESYRTRTDVSGNVGEYFERWTGAISDKDMLGPSWK